MSANNSRPRWSPGRSARLPNATVSRPVWVLLGLAAITSTACVALALLAWQEARRTDSLQAELRSEQSERQAVESRLLTQRGILAEMESRLAKLEESATANELAELQAKQEAASGSQDITELKASIAEVLTRTDNLQAALDSLSTRLGALEAGGNKPTEVRLTVGRQQQTHSLSCESSAASMSAHYHGVSLSEAEVLEALPRSENPHLGFRGSVDGPTGGIEDYGVYAGPIIEVLNQKGLCAWQVEGGIEGIQTALARGNPVIAWITYNCLPSTPTTVTIGAQEVLLVPYQHTVVVTGYSSEGVWANDPEDGKEDFYPYPDLERALGYFGFMAIEVAAAP